MKDRNFLLLLLLLLLLSVCDYTRRFCSTGSSWSPRRRKVLSWSWRVLLAVCALTDSLPGSAKWKKLSTSWSNMKPRLREPAETRQRPGRDKEPAETRQRVRRAALTCRKTPQSAECVSLLGGSTRTHTLRCTDNTAPSLRALSLCVGGVHVRAHAEDSGTKKQEVSGGVDKTDRQLEGETAAGPDTHTRLPACLTPPLTYAVTCSTGETGNMS